jgi:hypothetical protein
MIESNDSFQLKTKRKKMMKMMTKLVMLVLGVMLVSATFAANTNMVNKSLFNAGEVGLSIASGYNFGTAGSVQGSTLFSKPYALNFNAGAFYFPWRNVGFEANVPFYQSSGVSVDEVQVGTLFRLPLSKTTPILKNIAPYIGVGGVYNWQTQQDWAYIAKVGTEFRLNKNWGIFAEGQYRNFEFKNFDQGNVGVNGGLHLVF